MPLYDFRCSESHTTEAIRPSEVRRIACPLCDLVADRQFSSRVGIVGPTTDMRGMFRRYQEASAEMGGPPSQTWSAAKAQANAMTAAGEAPSIRTS